MEVRSIGSGSRMSKLSKNKNKREINQTYLELKEENNKKIGENLEYKI